MIEKKKLRLVSVQFFVSLICQKHKGYDRSLICQKHKGYDRSLIWQKYKGYDRNLSLIHVTHKKEFQKT